MAVSRRRPQPGLLHHFDRGSQYTSSAYQDVLAQTGLIVSMSRTGNWYDKAPRELFLEHAQVGKHLWNHLPNTSVSLTRHF
ncbi:hypothetical protein KDW_49480 [Dictyobacter vulcani]|uniref:Integrase catalytic domain-containing protein n=1 Tax=Dictyobacter vulcani TaxID=2607529 RepID=A0A5J4KZX6_9CHLR|nr:DDE-type integrase/transposase/recombinase [Dictyobacter vulcani]GER90786.1 hypothetical protein KDW_49480 [Dictyobacter vulcani]